LVCFLVALTVHRLVVALVVVGVGFREVLHVGGYLGHIVKHLSKRVQVLILLLVAIPLALLLRA
jgi:hypothetical protein